MSDVALKQQKLAAARKKLKEYNKKKNDQITKSRETSPFVEVLSQHKTGSSSSSSSFTDIGDIANCQTLDKIPSFQDSTQETLDTTSENFIIATKDPIDFKIVTKDSIENPLMTDCQIGKIDSYFKVDTTNPTTEFDDIVPYNTSENMKEQQNSDKKSQELEKKLDINPISLALDYDVSSICSETNTSLTTVIQAGGIDTISTSEAAMQSENIHSSKTISSPFSTTENLRQLSLQVSGLVMNTEMPEATTQDLTIKSLESRNNELASLLEIEKQKSLQNSSQLEEMKHTVLSQTSQIQSFQSTATSTSDSEVCNLKEQLQVHSRTIGILVAEKAEFQNNVAHTQYALQQKTAQCTEMQGRLSSSQNQKQNLEETKEELLTKVASLERNVAQNDNKYAELQKKYNEISHNYDDNCVRLAELSERLSVHSEEKQRLSSQVAELRSKNEMQHIQLQQFRSHTPTEEDTNSLVKAQADAVNMQKQLSVAQGHLQHAQAQQAALQAQYQAYASQLLAEIETMKANLHSKSEELESSESLKLELNSKLDAWNLRAKGSNADHMENLKTENCKLTDDLTQCQSQKTELENQCNILSRDKATLSSLLTEHRDQLESFERAEERRQTESYDVTTILKTAQSDKVAASRALVQNKQLKEQLEELQNGFIMMSNKKLELSEKLERELHAKKNLMSEISALGQQLADSKEQILLKGRQLANTKIADPLNQRHIQQTDNVERQNTTNIERQDPTHKRQEKTDEQLETTDKRQGTEERQNTTNKHQVTDERHETKDERQNTTNKQQGTIDNDERQRTTDDIQQKSDREVKIDTTEEKLKIKTEIQTAAISSNGEISNFESELIALRSAHALLEGRFTSAMKQLAALSDEKQVIEHTVQRLQLETDTVGDYITLYQFQRGVMKQQLMEMENELELLKTEKAETATRLRTLQALMQKLLTKGKDQHIIDKYKMEMKRIEDVINSDNKVTTSQPISPNSIESQSSIATEERQKTTTPIYSKAEKGETVNQIMHLIKQMEASCELDVAAFNRFHPCAHCSGQLITI